jgi:HEPN domain-containing protein
MRQADAELRAVHDLLRGGHWSWCCFTSQQAAEKALKAILEHCRTGRVGHNLNVLLAAVEEHTHPSENVRGACARLNRHYIPTRYPNAFDRGAPAEQYFETDARHALADAEEVIAFARAIVRTP